MPLSDDAIATLLRDPSIHSTKILRSGGRVAVARDAIVELAVNRHDVSAGTAGAAVDDFMTRHGATRQTTIDLDNLGKRLLERLRGRNKAKPSAIYEMPSSLVSGPAAGRP